MMENGLRELMPQLEEFHKRHHGFFCRSEDRQWSRKCLIGLLFPIERKNMENIAEEVGAAGMGKKNVSATVLRFGGSWRWLSHE